jgi:hypothetical protein
MAREIGSPILMSAGEVSGDAAGGRVAVELRRRCPGVRLFGVGGDIVPLTRRMAALYEGWVREDPDQWRWVHWRWKHRPDGTVETYSRRDLRACFAAAGPALAAGVATPLTGGASVVPPVVEAAAGTCVPTTAAMGVRVNPAGGASGVPLSSS